MSATNIKGTVRSSKPILSWSKKFNKVFKYFKNEYEQSKENLRTMRMIKRMIWFARYYVLMWKRMLLKCYMHGNYFSLNSQGVKKRQSDKTTWTM